MAAAAENFRGDESYGMSPAIKDVIAAADVPSIRPPIFAAKLSPVPRK